MSGPKLDQTGVNKWGASNLNRKRTQKVGVHSDEKSLTIGEKYSGKRLHC